MAMDKADVQNTRAALNYLRTVMELKGELMDELKSEVSRISKGKRGKAKDK